MFFLLIIIIIIIGSKLHEIIAQAGGSKDDRRLVTIPKAENDTLIKIQGTKDVVSKIVKAMGAIVAERANQTTETIDIPTDKHRGLIGRGGEIKKELESKFSVSLDIPRQGTYNL